MFYYLHRIILSIPSIKQKKGVPNGTPLDKIGSDLLFHKQVQYHRRGKA